MKSIIFSMANKTFRRSQTFVRLALLLLLISNYTFSQSLSLFDIDTSSFPIIKAKFYAFDKDGNQITNLTPTEFELKENGQLRTITNVSCPVPKPPEALSSVLVMDASGSMRGGNLNLAKEAAKAWVEGLPLGKSECAITAFDTKNYMVQDFTTDKTKLINAANTLFAGGGTDYDAAMLDPMSGGLLVTKQGKYKRVIVFLSDGRPNREPQTASIISEANRQNVTVYAVTLGMTCPQCLKDISTQTGGMWYENVTTVEQARQIYQQILQTAQGGDACIIEWESGVTCVAGNTQVELTLQTNGAKATTSYASPNTSVAKLEFNPTSVKFSDPQVGVKVEQQVTVTARNAQFTVTNITSNNGAFEILPKSFVLNAGQSMEITVSYIAADSGYNYCKFEIENNVCPTKYYASGGWKGKKPKVRTIKLIHPNGGEVFIAGSDTVITWEGVPPDEPVKLEYRTDDNQPWITISDTAKGLSHRFIVPKIASKKYLARVTAASKTSSYCDNPDLELCGKIWMGCNLDVDTYRNGDPIRHAQSDAEWLDANNKKEGAWCYYDNNDSLGRIYGKLYNWYAVNDARGLAPEGWHVPTDEEWKELEICLGMSRSEADKMGWRGTDEGSQLAGQADLWADGVLKSNSNFGKSGFSAVPGGGRFNYGTFFDVGLSCYWWSSSESSATLAWYRSLGYIYSNVFRSSLNKDSGFSVRCVRD